MRVLIMADMEGVSGIVVWDQVNGGAPMYEEGRRLYTEEINAAVRGAKAAGATEVVVVNRTPERAESAAALAGAAGRVGVAADLEQVDLIVNATPLGLAGADPHVLPLDPHLLGPGQLLVDLVPNPAVTPLMRAARDQGARVAGGLGMLVHQGALAFELWTGHPAPIGVMRAAALQALPR